MIAKTVSVIIPTYNYKRFITQTINSCLNQTYRSVEIIVVDDGSTDGTNSVVSQFGDRIVYLCQENKGVSSARNAGLEHAQGEFVCFLDADDYFLPDAIELMVDVLEQKSDVGIVIGQSYQKEENGSAMRRYVGWDHDRKSNALCRDFLLGNLPITSPLIRGELARQFRFPNRITNGEDIAYYAKLLFSASVYLLAKPVLVIVRHPDCLHKNIETIARQGTSLIPTLLDDPFYDGAIDHLRNDIKSAVYLSLFRSFYLAGRRRQSRKYYLRALYSKPGSIWRLSYLTKYLRTFFYLEPNCGNLAR